MKKVAIFIGTRPEGIKLAPVVQCFRKSSAFETIVVNTGQHQELLDQVLTLFEIEPDVNLKLMRKNQSLSQLSARLLVAIDEVLREFQPDFILVQGDTTTVFTAALSAFYLKIPVGHVEAGLRTGDLQAPFPEEANRVLTSRICQLHFAPTQTAHDNLLREGVPKESIFVTGNTVIDALQSEVTKQRHSNYRKGIYDKLSIELGSEWWKHPFVLVTGHRRENFGKGFAEICSALRELAQKYPDTRFVYPVHLNPNVQKPVFEHLADLDNIVLIGPVSYSYFVALLSECLLVLTDSGGIQEEAPSLGKPVLVMREKTERPEGVESGTAKLVGAISNDIVSGVSQLLDNQVSREQMARAINPYGDGKSSERICDAVCSFLDGNLSSASKSKTA